MPDVTEGGEAKGLYDEANHPRVRKPCVTIPAGFTLTAAPVGSALNSMRLLFRQRDFVAYSCRNGQTVKVS